jgi:hypothetical protein
VLYLFQTRICETTVALEPGDLSDHPVHPGSVAPSAARGRTRYSTLTFQGG